MHVSIDLDLYMFAGKCIDVLDIIKAVLTWTCVLMYRKLSQ